MIKYIPLSLVLLFTSTGFAQNGKLVNKVLAQVGDNIILLSDIEIQKLQAKQSEMEVDFDFSCSVLEQLMVQELLVNQAKLDSIPVSDEQVDAEMEIVCELSRKIWEVEISSRNIMGRPLLK